MTSRGAGGFQNWQELRDHAVELFGEAPHPASEQEIIDAYQRHPTQVERAIEAIGRDVAAGTARSGWGVLRARANTIGQAISNPTRPAGLEREKRVGRAEAYVRVTGLHHPGPTELTLELFGSGGLLHDYAQAEYDIDNGFVVTGDTQLVQRITDLWHERQPVAQQIERDAITRAEEWKAWKTLELANGKEPCPPPTSQASSPASPSEHSPPGSSSPDIPF